MLKTIFGKIYLTIFTGSKMTIILYDLGCIESIWEHLGPGSIEKRFSQISLEWGRTNWMGVHIIDRNIAAAFAAGLGRI